MNVLHTFYYLLSMLKSNRPLYSFEDNSDYVYDVMWSPAHPALFACVDGVGHLDLWNLNSDTEVRPPPLCVPNCSSLMTPVYICKRCV